MVCCDLVVNGRKFIQLGNNMIPVDRIKEINLKAPNGGSDNSVRIVTDDPNDCFIWAYENADAIRKFLQVEGM